MLDPFEFLDNNSATAGGCCAPQTSAEIVSSFDSQIDTDTALKYEP